MRLRNCQALISVPPMLHLMFGRLTFGLKDTSVTEITSSFITTFHTALLKITSERHSSVQDIESSCFHPALPPYIYSEKKGETRQCFRCTWSYSSRGTEKIFNKDERNEFKGVLTSIWPKFNIIKCLLCMQWQLIIIHTKIYTHSFFFVCLFRGIGRYSCHTFGGNFTVSA